MLVSYLVLFSASFLAATILPFYSEVFLFAMVRQGEPVIGLLVVASIGNILGATLNWLLGRYLLRFKDRRWFYFKEEKIERMQRWFQRYGVWSLLLSWMPIGGDPLTFIAGVMRVPIFTFLLLVSIGKVARYVLVIYFSQLSLGLF